MTLISDYQGHRLVSKREPSRRAIVVYGRPVFAPRPEARRGWPNPSDPGELRDNSASSVRSLLVRANLRPTSQRLALAAILFGEPHRHVTAEELHAEARERHAALSLTTVYNNLDRFAAAGLVRRIATPRARTWFDTDVSDHQHFYVEDEDRIFNIPRGAIRVCGAIEPPDGYEVAKIDVVVRLRRIGRAALPGGDAGSGRNAATCPFRNSKSGVDG